LQQRPRWKSDSYNQSLSIGISGTPAAGVRRLPDNLPIQIGSLIMLRRFQNEVPEVQFGQECGMAFINDEDIRPDDVIEILEREKVERNL
jgi:translation initiation factor IF-2